MIQETRAVNAWVAYTREPEHTPPTPLRKGGSINGVGAFQVSPPCEGGARGGLIPARADVFKPNVNRFKPDRRDTTCLSQQADFQQADFKPSKTKVEKGTSKR